MENNTTTAKAIGSLAKKQSDVSRQPPSKLKFVPTLPQRRKKDDVVKPEPITTSVPPPADRGRGRGRGRGEGRGRGRGVPPVQMTASGPFAMGPAMAGSSSFRRAPPRSNLVPVPGDAIAAAAGAAGALTHSAPPSLRKEISGVRGSIKTEEDEEEVYSDPDEGVEIVDMENVRQMDWMAPESLRKQRQQSRVPKVKKEDMENGNDGGVDVDEKNALNLSESEEEEELEDIIEDFATQNTIIADGELTHEDRLYFFQFPAPFPKFAYKTDTAGTTSATALEIDSVPTATPKKVSFAPDVKPDTATLASRSRTPSIVPSKPEPAQPLDGVIGQLEVYKSGAVKIRLANGILLDVAAATQPSFLQQAVVLDPQTKQLSVLGEVNKQFVVSPNVDALLSALQADENNSTTELLDGLIAMDATAA